QKRSVPLKELALAIPALLEEIQLALFQRARDFRTAHTAELESLDAMIKFFETSVGFVVTPWCGAAEDERAVSQRTTATTRVILEGSTGGGKPCAVCGRPATVEVVWGKAY